MPPPPANEPISPALIASIRHSSRQLVRELGFMSSSLAGTSLSASAVHTLIEVGAAAARNVTLSAATLTPLLHLDKSSTSRLLRRLADAGLVAEALSPRDGREKLLALTPAGRDTLAAIDAFAEVRVGGALLAVGCDDRVAIERGLALYAGALRAARCGEDGEGELVVNGASAEQRLKRGGDEIAVVAGYRSGIIARSVEMHALFYAEHHGFGRAFETELSISLGRVVRRLDEPGVEAWAAVDGNGRIVGTVFVDVVDAHEAELENGNPDGDNAADGEMVKIAHLRMFIVEEAVQGKGVGRRLLAEAMSFVDAVGYAETKLYTFRGLDAAKKLYERFGFVMIKEELGNRWTTPVHVQMWVRKRGAGDIESTPR